jgi:hypothetical protein
MFSVCLKRFHNSLKSTQNYSSRNCKVLNNLPKGLEIGRGVAGENEGLIHVASVYASNWFYFGVGH